MDTGIFNPQPSSWKRSHTATVGPTDAVVVSLHEPLQMAVCTQSVAVPTD